MATRYRPTLLIVVPALMLAFSALAVAQDANTDDLVRQTQNPISSLISVPFQGNWDFGIGDRDSSATLLNFQPVMPFAASPSTNLILRVIVPLTSQPTTTEQRNNGIGDTLATGFFSPSKSSSMIWGAGPAVLLPTATNPLVGSEKFALGPSIVFLKQPGNITYGFLGNQIWSVDGAKDREAVNQAFLQPFFNYNLGNGLSAGFTIEATVKWEAANGKTTAPLILTINKIALLGKRPVNFQIGAGPMLASPDGGPKWRFRAAANFLYPR
jgi:hypothetical protein